MAAGMVLINLSPSNNRLFRAILPVTPPVYALFFVIAGTELDVTIFSNGSVLIFGSAYIVARAIGKYFGVRTACRLCNTDETLRKYLGFCMLPQAGVAIGLVLLIQAAPQMQNLSEEFASTVDMMVNIVLMSVFVNEIIGPPLSRMALMKGCSIDKAEE
jgi:Kef-type K+ transport system membrane component KefB